jgi:flagellar biosynthesis anti-sigma factor FlgM
MKIELTNVNLKKLLNAENEKKEVKAKKSSTGSTNSETDTVQFSADLEKAEKKIKEITDYPERRTERIQELKNMIKSGRYNVDVHKLTDSIIEDLLYGKFYE